MNKLKWALFITLAILVGVFFAFVINTVLQGKLPKYQTNTKFQSTPQNQPNASQALTKTLAIVSDIATVSANLANSSQLNSLLTEIGIRKQDNVVLYKPSGMQVKRIEVGPLVIHLTDQPQPLGKVVSIQQDKTEYQYQGFGMSFNEISHQLDLFLFVHPAIIKSESEEKLEQRFSSELLSAIFDITHPLLPEHKSFEERLVGKDDFMKKLIQIPKETFIQIQKNK